MSSTVERTNPQAGEALTIDDIGMILNLVKVRQEKHDDEPAAISVATVMLGVGKGFADVECAEQEFTCKLYQLELPKEGPPKCPNGHALKVGPGLKLGWLTDTTRAGMLG